MAGAVLRVDITQGNPQPMPIALPDFLAGTGGEGDIAHNVTGIITSNLQRSGLFAPIDQAAVLLVGPDSKVQLIAIGDGANDMPMMDEAAISVAYRAKPIVREFAAFALDHSGLDGVLNFFL